jgi:small-conductance mechanosensitive channel
MQNITSEYGNYFSYTVEATFCDTIKNIFVRKKERTSLLDDDGIQRGKEVPLSEKHVYGIRNAGYILFGLSLLIAALAITAIFFPPLAALAGLLGLSTIVLGCIAGGAVLFGVVSLIFGYSAHQKIRLIQFQPIYN